MEQRSGAEREERDGLIVTEEAMKPADDGDDKRLCPAPSVCTNYNFSV